MLTKTITYKDFDDVERTEKFYFNLTKSEVTMMEMSTEGGLKQKIEKIVAEKNGQQIIALFEEILFKAYGEKSADGKQFVKSPEISKAFSFTNAYDQLFMSLVSDPEEAAAFIQAVLPPAP